MTTKIEGTRYFLRGKYLVPSKGIRKMKIFVLEYFCMKFCEHKNFLIYDILHLNHSMTVCKWEHVYTLLLLEQINKEECKSYLHYHNNNNCSHYCDGKHGSTTSFISQTRYLRGILSSVCMRVFHITCDPFFTQCSRIAMLIL